MDDSCYLRNEVIDLYYNRTANVRRRFLKFSSEHCVRSVEFVRREGNSRRLHRRVSGRLGVTTRRRIAGRFANHYRGSVFERWHFDRKIRPETPVSSRPIYRPGEIRLIVFSVERTATSCVVLSAVFTLKMINGRSGERTVYRRFRTKTPGSGFTRIRRRADKNVLGDVGMIFNVGRVIVEVDENGFGRTVVASGVDGRKR